MSTSRKATFSRRFVIVGGGIAGLASAYALQQAGHQTLVLEKACGPIKEPGGIRSPPNMTRILLQWGLGPHLARLAIKGSAIAFKLSSNGEKIGQMVFHDQVMKALAGDWLFLQHSDLYAWLKSMAEQAGATVRFSCEVVSIDAAQALVRLSTGETCSGDMLIGADGLDSVVRRCMSERIPVNAPSKLWISDSSISAKSIQLHKELLPILSTSELTMWLGDGYCIWGHPSRDYEVYALIISAPVRSRCHDQYDDGRHVAQEFDIDVQSLEPKLRKLLELDETISPTPLIMHGPLESLVHETGKIILVGTAAHPLPSGQTQNVAIGIEDAATLGNLFSRLRSQAQMSALVSAYDDIRRSRSAEVIQSELGKLQTITLPFGDQQLVRDNGLRAALSQALLDWDHADEALLRAQWEEYIHIFNYDANEVADDWWIKWGALMDQPSLRQQHMEVTPPPMEISISSVSGTAA